MRKGSAQAGDSGKKKLRIEYRAVDSLVPYARNARTHSDLQIDQVVASIREFGWTNPVLLDGENGIIAGHARVEAAKRIGLTDIPCIEFAGLSEAQKRAYIIADNKLALNAGWDEELLRLEMTDLADLDFNMELLGFEETELAELMQPTPAGGLTDPDAVPEAPKIAATLPGDLWLLDKHRLLCGNATDPKGPAQLLGALRPSLMVTDPPYGVEYDPAWRARAGVNLNKKKLGRVINDDRADWREAWQHFPGDVAYVWHASLFTSVVLASLEAAGFEHRAMIIWAKDRFTLSRGHYQWQHEPAWYAVRKGKTGHWCGDRSQSTVWNIKAREDSGHGHGTQKPVECMRRPIVNHTNPGQCVYDPFVGSGTTIIAAETIGRVCLAIDIEPAYVDVAVERWQNFTGMQAILEADGRSFDEIKSERRGPEISELEAADLEVVAGGDA